MGLTLALVWSLAAHATPPVVDPVLDLGGGLADAEYLPLPDGRVAIAAIASAPQGLSWVLLPERAGAGGAGTWTVLPTPGGTLVSADDGIWAVTAWDAPLRAGRVWQLDGTSWQPRPTLPDGTGVGGVQAVRVDAGGVAVWAHRSGTLVERRVRDGVWRDRTHPNTTAWDDEGTVYLRTRATVHGRRRHAVPQVTADAPLVFDEDAAGRPLFVAADDGRLRVWFAGAAHTEAVPASERVDRSVCPETPRTEVVVVHQLPTDGRLAFGPREAVVPWVQSTQTLQTRCVERPPHPCDPAGPVDTCPRGPIYDFPPVRGSESWTRELKVLRGHGDQWEAVSIEVPFQPVRVLDTRVEGGETWLLVEGGTDRGTRTLYHVRLGSSGPPAEVVWPVQIDVEPLALDQVLAAGLSPGLGSSTTAPPASWSEGGLETGGARRGAAWIDLVGPRTDDPLTLTVRAEVSPWGTDCGQPEIRLWRGTEAHSLLLGGPSALLVASPTDPPLSLDAPGHGSHAWTLSLSEDGLVVAVDDVVVHRRAVPPSSVGGLGGSFGQRSSCGVPVGPAVRWRGVRATRAPAADL